MTGRYAVNACGALLREAWQAVKSESCSPRSSQARNLREWAGRRPSLQICIAKLHPSGKCHVHGTTMDNDGQRSCYFTWDLRREQSVLSAGDGHQPGTLYPERPRRRRSNLLMQVPSAGLMLFALHQSAALVTSQLVITTCDITTCDIHFFNEADPGGVSRVRFTGPRSQRCQHQLKDTTEVWTPLHASDIQIYSTWFHLPSRLHLNFLASSCLIIPHLIGLHFFDSEFQRSACFPVDSTRVFFMWDKGTRRRMSQGCSRSMWISMY